MDARIKIFFTHEDLTALEKEVNCFLAKTQGELVSIEYDTILAVDIWGTGILLTYKPEEKVEQPEEKAVNQESEGAPS